MVLPDIKLALRKQIIIMIMKSWHSKFFQNSQKNRLQISSYSELRERANLVLTVGNWSSMSMRCRCWNTLKRTDFMTILTLGYDQQVHRLAQNDTHHSENWFLVEVKDRASSIYAQLPHAPQLSTHNCSRSNVKRTTSTSPDPVAIVMHRAGCVG